MATMTETERRFTQTVQPMTDSEHRVNTTASVHTQAHTAGNIQN